MATPVTSPVVGTRRPVATTLAAVAGVAALGAILNRLTDERMLSAQGLLLVLPVVAAAVIGGRLAAFASAAAATLTFALLIPPTGSPRVRLTQDTVALVVFTVVALAISETSCAGSPFSTNSNATGDRSCDRCPTISARPFRRSWRPRPPCSGNPSNPRHASD